MKLITVNGQVFKGKWSCKNDTIYGLPHTFVLKGIIEQSEWALSRERIVERFDLSLTETKIDGRLKQYKAIPYFSWGYLPFTIAKQG